MGYTHYWTFSKAKRGATRATAKQYQQAILDCQKIVRAYSVANGGLAGFAAHTEPGQYGGLKVNGSRELAHEDFVLREHFAQAVEGKSDFCKTARKPYDTVVVACLCVLAHYLPSNFSVSSDGDSLDWIAGLELARRVLKNKKIAIPRNIRVRLGAM